MCHNHIRRESMQNEHLWRNLSTTTMMSTDFDRRYQQQGFNLQFPAGFNCDLASSNSVSTINLNEFGGFSAAKRDRKTFKVMLAMYLVSDNGLL